MVKYKQQVQDMLAAHNEIFKAFKELHDKYEKDPKKWQEEFNEKGFEVQALLRRWENNLCGKSESGQYGKFSSTLADKFRAEVKVHFPKIDFIGMKS
ncbi:MAG TPA: hypothetical protein VLF93_04115 [Candidatus Saccharimonadales bacterium]|nr:hypothetical protein [Candidatus Saccharimonadales bacterium]